MFDHQIVKMIVKVNSWSKIDMRDFAFLNVLVGGYFAELKNSNITKLEKITRTEIELLIIDLGG